MRRRPAARVTAARRGKMHGMAGGIGFFELGVEDVERGRAFYEGLFGWRFERGPTGGWHVETGGTPGGIHGGDARASPYVFFAVDDMDAALARVRELGGEIEDVNVEGDPEQVARIGRFKLCRDDQGSSFGLHQPPRG
jgi:predicted enzyme related to lactoylglutathione lyase